MRILPIFSASIATVMLSSASMAAPPANSNAGGMRQCTAELDAAYAAIDEVSAERDALAATLSPTGSVGDLADLTGPGGGKVTLTVSASGVILAGGILRRVHAREGIVSTWESLTQGQLELINTSPLYADGNVETINPLSGPDGAIDSTDVGGFDD